MMTYFIRLIAAFGPSTTTRRKHRRFTVGIALVLLMMVSVFPGNVGHIRSGLFAQNSPPAGKTDPTKSAGTEKPAKAIPPVGRLVRIRAVVNLYQPMRPYAAPEIREWIGSGIWLGGGHVLTDLRLVRFASVLEFWPPGTDHQTTRPKSAILQHRGHDCGLAVISDESDAVGKLATGLESIFANQPVATAGQELKVFGFGPSDSGDRANPAQYRLKARGVLVREFDPAGLISGSDIDRQALYRTEPVRSTAPPGRGYSGGPAVIGDRITGIYFYEAGPARPYVLEAGVIKAFLADIASDGRYNGFPRTGMHFESIGTGAARRYLGLDKLDLKTGVLVRRVDFQSAAWGKVLPGDVLLSINAKPVDFVGRIVVSDAQRISVAAWLRGLPGAVLKLKLLRRGKPIEATLNLKSPTLRQAGPGRTRLLDQPKYFLGGGLVFQELEYDLIHSTTIAEGASGLAAEPQILHRYYNYYTDRIGEQVERDVVLTARLPDPVNADANRFINGIVRSVNGRRIRNIKDFAAEWKYTRAEYVVIEFLNREHPLILEFAPLQAAEKRIQSRYQLQENGRVR